MEFEDDRSTGDIQNLQEMIQDLTIEDGSQVEFHKSDAVMFMVYLSKDMLEKREGQQFCDLEKIFKGLQALMSNKIISNPSDKVGLILLNTKQTKNTLNFENITVLQHLVSPDAHAIKDARNLIEKFRNKEIQISDKPSQPHHGFWLQSHEIKDLDPNKFHLRLFYFTASDFSQLDQDKKKEQAISHANQLRDKGVIIELFPILRSRTPFNIKSFFISIITLDLEQVNESTVAEQSLKLMDLQERIRQKQYKKRTLNRLTIKLGLNETQAGFKIYSTFSKARKPTSKKVDAQTNKLLQRVVKKMNKDGQTLFENQINTCYTIGNERVKLSREDMKKIKQMDEQIGITLIGFKPKSYFKRHYNIRTSYFIYPDDQHVTGSSAFADALITQCLKKSMIPVVKVVPRAGQELRFAALFPQQQNYNQVDGSQTPPGFYMIFLPFADDIANLIGQKTVVPPVTISTEIVERTKCLINNMTIPDFDFRNFQNPSLQKFYAHLQAHALNEKQVQQRPDLLQPDLQGLSKFSDLVASVKSIALRDVECFKKQEVKVKEQNNGKMPKKKKKGQDVFVKEQVVEMSPQMMIITKKILNIVNHKFDWQTGRRLTFDDVLKSEMKKFLIFYGTSTEGNKADMWFRIIDLVKQKRIMQPQQQKPVRK